MSPPSRRCVVFGLRIAIARARAEHAAALLLLLLVSANFTIIVPICCVIYLFIFCVCWKFFVILIQCDFGFLIIFFDFIECKLFLLKSKVSQNSISLNLYLKQVSLLNLNLGISVLNITCWKSDTSINYLDKENIELKLKFVCLPLSQINWFWLRLIQLNFD